MPQNNRSIDSAVQPCAEVKHTFQVTLGPAPDPTPRPAYWPVDSASAFGGENMNIALGGVDVAQTLDGGGSFNASSIPPGVANVHFNDFYDAVHADVDSRTNLSDD